MSAATSNRAPNVDAIATDLANEHPDWNRERLYAEAHGKYVTAMRAFADKAVARFTADPAVMMSIRTQRAEQEARRSLRAEPQIAVLMVRERDRLMRHDGLDLAEATSRAYEAIRELSRQWNADLLGLTSTILARDAAQSFQLAVPKAPVAKAAPAPRTFVPGGMSRAQAQEEAARPGGLPVLMGAGPNEGHERLMTRVRSLQATRADCRDYTAAFVTASRELADEDAAAGAK